MARPSGGLRGLGSRRQSHRCNPPRRGYGERPGHPGQPRVRPLAAPHPHQPVRGGGLRCAVMRSAGLRAGHQIETWVTQWRSSTIAAQSRPPDDVNTTDPGSAELRRYRQVQPRAVVQCPTADRPSPPVNRACRPSDRAGLRQWSTWRVRPGHPTSRRSAETTDRHASVRPESPPAALDGVRRVQVDHVGRRCPRSRRSRQACQIPDPQRPVLVAGGRAREPSAVVENDRHPAGSAHCTSRGLTGTAASHTPIR